MTNGYIFKRFLLFLCIAGLVGTTFKKPIRIILTVEDKWLP